MRCDFAQWTFLPVSRTLKIFSYVFILRKKRKHHNRFILPCRIFIRIRCELVKIWDPRLDNFCILWPVIDSISVTFGQICNFCDPNEVTFYLYMYLILNKEHFTFHLHYKHSGTFANCKCEKLSHPKNQKVCDSILVTIFVKIGQLEVSHFYEIVVNSSKTSSI